MEQKVLYDNKVIISCAVTGASTSKALNPALPTTPKEIADTVYNVWQAGASIVHLHMRDEEYRGTMSVERFRETVYLIREHKDCDVIINCTSSGAATKTNAERYQHFIDIPEIEVGSFDVGTMNFAGNRVFMNSPSFLEELAGVMYENDVLPEIEIFDMGMLGNAKDYWKRGVLKTKWCQLVLGVLGGMDATIENLSFLQRHLPEDAIWSATGIGKGHLPVMYGAIALGGHVRVGLEDNTHYASGIRATNEMLVERAVRVAKEYNRPVATPTEAREILGLKPLVR